MSLYNTCSVLGFSFYSLIFVYWMDFMIENYIDGSGLILDFWFDLIKCGISRVTDFE